MKKAMRHCLSNRSRRRFQCVKLVPLFFLLLIGCNGDLNKRADVRKPSSIDPAIGSGREAFPKSNTAFERWRACAALQTSVNGQSPTDTGETFEASRGRDQLLTNLKFIWDERLLIREGFFDASVIGRLFGSSEVRPMDAPSLGNAAEVKLLVTNVGAGSHKAMTATIEGKCVVLGTGHEVSSSTRDTEIYGSIAIDAESDSTIQLGTVRSIFGPEAESIPDRGISAHGYAYAPVYKGKVVYYSDAQSSDFKRLTFYLKLDKSGSGQSRDEIGDEDVVARIEMNVEHARKWRSQ